MIDIHSHIIPQFDDGSESWEQSLDMLREAEEDGITDIVATPHILTALDFERENELIDVFGKLEQRRSQAGFNIRLHLGCEIYAHPEMQLDRTIATLANNGRYFLVEFPMDTIPVFVADQFFELATDGFTPIIAHPERNMGFLRNPQQATEFIERGALFQLNAGSLRGTFGRRVRDLSERMMDAGLVHFIASDSHNSSSRAPRLGKTYELVALNWGADMADTLFVENPSRALRGEQVCYSEPGSLESARVAKGVRGWLSKLRNQAKY